ncbi:MAG: BRO family protein [Acidovorax sp.]|uniref:BRO family protein n=1 Tax=Acidovorax sp. TaxID=1872122 RepID=UPI0039E22531
MKSALQPLVFDDTVFTVVDRDGQPWLRAPEIATALGYAREDAVSGIYRRNADEFSAEMSQTVNLTVSQNGGQLQRETRIFSLRGAYLLGMFASTPPAKRFRRWVLDVLEGKAQAQAQPARAAQAAPQQGDLFGASVPQQLFDEVALLRQLHATQTRLVQLLEEQIRGRKRNKPQPLTVDEIKLARSLKAQGVSQSAIARHMGRSQATISLILRDLH